MIKDLHNDEIGNRDMRGTSQSAAEYSISLKKPPTVNNKF